MFIRVLFLLLLALNLGSACWLYFAPAPHTAMPPATDPGVAKLVLLSEQEPSSEAAAAELVAAPETKTDLSEDACLSIGPFATQADMRAAVNQLTPLVKRIQFREERATQSRGYWVYLPAFKTREQALAAARQLSTKGVRDYYVVTAGDQQNTISLGLFREQANAEHRRAEIIELGFTPQMAARTEELPAYWIDFAENRHRLINWRASLRDTVGLTEQPIECF